MRRAKRTLAIVALSLVSCSTPVLPASTPTSGPLKLRVYATTATLPLLNDLMARYSSLNPTITFEAISGNFDVVFESLLTDSSPSYLLTNHLPDENLNDTPTLAWPIGQDGIAVIVHPDNKVHDLTTDQLRSIYLGHVTNWQDVGGADLDLTILSREDGSGTRAEFERLVMGERLTTLAAQMATSSEALVTMVARDPGSIGYVSLSYLDDRVRALAVDGILPTPDSLYENHYPLRATLFIIGVQEPQEAERDFISWIQGVEGQQIVGERHAPLLR
jgi:phosphate transport system substrate-binding protein